MERRSFIKGSGLIIASAVAANSSNAQSTFSYEKPITIDTNLAIPEDEKIRVAFVINPGVQVIDLAGPWEVFQDVFFRESDAGKSPGPAFELFTVSERIDTIRATAGLQIVPDYTVKDAPDPHITVIPHFSTSGVTEIHDWIKEKSTVAALTMSICTGAFQLAKTGLIDGKIVTTNQNAYDLFEESYPKPILKRGPRFVEVDNIATSGGLTAGIDLALRTVDRILGRAIAQRTADNMEYISEGWKV